MSLIASLLIPFSILSGILILKCIDRLNGINIFVHNFECIFLFFHTLANFVFLLNNCYLQKS